MLVESKPERTHDDVDRLVEKVRRVRHRLSTPADLDPLIERIGDARYVLLGEASHGTSEFYTWRAAITRRLIAEKGFSFVAVEGDWPDCYDINRFVKGYCPPEQTAYGVLKRFNRWPTWMWANWEVLAFIDWLKEHNAASGRKAGFYGLDVYSLWESMEEILHYLEKTAPESVPVARRAFQCFEPYERDEQSYAWSTSFITDSCEQEVIDLLMEVRRKARAVENDPEAAFDAEQNATVMANAELYYRAMVRGGAESWNIRDQHMVDTLDRLMRHHGPEARGIVWAHNTHVGDAAATDMTRSGMTNIGRLVREEHADRGVVLVGFGSNHGSVIAAGGWGRPMESMEVPEAQDDSWEDVLARAGDGDKLIITEDLIGEPAAVASRGHRAIGVVYDPETESWGNYVPTVLPLRYDAFLYIDETTALSPLHLRPALDAEPPETYPSGM